MQPVKGEQERRRLKKVYEGWATILYSGTAWSWLCLKDISISKEREGERVALKEEKDDTERKREEDLWACIKRRKESYGSCRR